MIGDIAAEVCALNLIGDPFLYRLRLAGLIAFYGRVQVQAALIMQAADAGDKIVSIATASNWQRSRMVNSGWRHAS